jgi:DNA-binding MarR family transcriptional regulator
MAQNARTGSREVAARLHSVAIHLLRRVRRVDEGMGLSPARASALSVLVFGGERTIGELAAAEQVTAPTMTRLVTGLEKDGYLKRSSDPLDGRVTRVSATPKGRKVLEEGRDRRVAELLEMLTSLSASEQATVERAVALLERALRQPAGASQEE